MARVLIVDDSPTARQYLEHLINANGDLEVMGLARDGVEAIELVRRERPDVVVMDTHMPRMDGYHATKEIMETYPVPIVICATDWEPGGVEKAFRAMEAGAVAAVGKPGPGDHGTDDSTDRFIRIVKLMSEVKVVRRRPRVRRLEPERATPTHPRTKLPRPRIEVIAMGASAGGPPVIRTILSKLGGEFPIPILVVQHIATGFLGGLVDWLKKSTGLPIHIPIDRECIAAGHIYFAPEGCHMGVTMSGKIVLSATPPDRGLRPSISHLFNSVADAFGKKAVGVLLTGMGADGAHELKKMKAMGAVTIAQDKASSVVHSMPRKAIEIGGTDYILPPEEIADILYSLARK